MKKILYSLMALSALAFASCSSDDDFDSEELLTATEGQFPYDSDGVWLNNDKSGYLNIDDYVFSHILDEWNLVYGFTPSKVADASKHTPLYQYPYASASGGGVSGAGSPYLVGYWAEYLEGDNATFNQRTCRIYDEDGDRFQPQSAMVCCNTYLKYAALDGTDMTEPLKPGDWVTLVAHGVHEDGTEDQAVFYLINDSSSNVADAIQDTWAYFDLTGLGTCVGMYFTMDCSSDYKTEYGMLLPSYFCIDQIKVRD